MKFKLYLITVLSLSFMFVGCETNPHQNNDIETDSVIVELPKSEENQKFGLFKMTQRATKDAGLKILDKGFDSLFIRIWQNLDTTALVMDLIYSENAWRADLHTIQLAIADDEIVYGSTRSFSTAPKSGWINFSKKIFKTGLLDLPSDIKLKDYHNTSAADAGSVTVEIATKKHYRIYGYTQPGMHLKYPEARKMTEILEYLSFEFSFDIAERFIEKN